VPTVLAVASAGFTTTANVSELRSSPSGYWPAKVLMTVTEAIAILGAVTGTTGAILGVLSYRRDRAKIVLHTNPTWGVGPFHSTFFLHIEVVNAGRQAVTIAQVEVLNSRFRGLSKSLRFARFARWRKLIAQAGHFTEIGAALAAYQDPIALAPGDRKQYTLRAKSFEAHEKRKRAGFTYVYVVDTQRRVVAKRVHMDGSSDSWETG
jgi:hypothetical protein